MKAIVSLGRSTGADVRITTRFGWASQFGAGFSEPLAPLAFFESGIPSPELSCSQNILPTSSGGDTGPKTPTTCTSRAPRCYYLSEKQH